jgi:tetratricopeptide (TPR) repeat protein
VTATATRPPSPARYAEDGTRIAKKSRFKGQYDQSWAALIGIDDYTDYRKLRFAAADAVAMARALIEHRRFPAKHVFLITQPAGTLRDDLAAWLAANRTQLGCVQDEASKQAIEKLLYETLPSGTGADDRVGPDDRVLVYFAGHGVPRAVTSDLRGASPYLAPAKARRGHWREHIDLDDVLKEGNFLAAKHVLYVLDACCSGLADKRASDETKRYERKMLYLKARQCLTAGTREQRVDDGLDGAHSPFTGTLLRLLDGSLETRHDEALCVSTVGAALKVAVAQLATATEQVPALFTTRGDRGGEFVFAAFHAAISLSEQAALARTLVHDVGRCLDEPAPIEFAAKLWKEILTASRDGDPLWLEALREHARTLLLLGDSRAALDELEKECLSGDPETQLLRAIAWLHEDEREQAAGAHNKPAGALDHAAGALDALLVLRNMLPHPYADWAQWAIAVARTPRARRFALLIGVDEIPSSPGSRLQGCGHDVAAMAQLLRERLGFTDVTALVDSDATIARILGAFEGVAREIKLEDSFVCYICGPGYLRSGVPAYPSYDLDFSVERMLTDADVDGAMRSIPAHDKLLITDGCHLAPVSNAPLAGYRFLHACRHGERSEETISPDGTHRGAFTYALERTIRTLRNAPIGRIVAQVSTELATMLTLQTPGHTGSGSARLLELRPPALEVVDLAQISHRSLAAERIETFEGQITEAERVATERGQAGDMAPLWLAIGRAWLARGRLDPAIAALTRADHPAARLPRIEAQLRAGRYGDAFHGWTTWRAAPPDTAMQLAEPGQIEELQGLLEAARSDTRRALLVATDDPGASGARELVKHARVALLDRFAMHESNITVLSNASAGDVVEAFRALIAAAQGPALFLFIGPGFDGSDVWLATNDGDRPAARLCASELRAIADSTTRLTSALLITRSESPAVPQPRSDIVPPEREQPEIGRATLVVTPPRHRDLELTASRNAVETLIEVMERKGHPTFTFADWRKPIDDSQGSRLRGHPSTPILPYTTQHDRILSLLRDIVQSPLRPALTSLKRLATQPENAADAWLQIAIIEAQRGRHEDAKAAADEALARRRADQPDRSDGAVRATSTGKFPEAHYHRGRILLALGRHSEAEAELRLAVEEQPDHARAHYYRERAIRALIGSDLENQRAKSIASYLQHGAPFGVEDEAS